MCKNAKFGMLFYAFFFSLLFVVVISGCMLWIFVCLPSLFSSLISFLLLPFSRRFHIADVLLSRFQIFFSIIDFHDFKNIIPLFVCSASHNHHYPLCPHVQMLLANTSSDHVLGASVRPRATMINYN
jgi:hypothetical protein